MADLELEARPKQHATLPEGEFTQEGMYFAPAVDIYDTPYELVLFGRYARSQNGGRGNRPQR